MKKHLRFIAIFAGIIFLSGCYNVCDQQNLPVPMNDGNEPPMNQFLADSPWPMSHRNPYCQASSPYAGPLEYVCNDDYLFGEPGLTVIAVSGMYPDGSRVLWGNNISSVFKISSEGIKTAYINKLDKDSTIGQPDYGGVEPTITEKALSGAYTLVDKEGIFYVPDFKRIIAFKDSIPSDSTSPIEVQGIFQIPEEQLNGTTDKIVGLNITHDGMLAIATGLGTVGVISRDFNTAHYLNLGQGEEISNSVACDEEGGIYVVTSNYLYRVQWTGSELTTDEVQGGWRAEYETGDAQSGIRLGEGSGATPTLMGTGDQDKFVVITDGQDLMHLVLFWRNQIPSDWAQIPGTKDRRIAGQIPVTFGDPQVTASLSEQSVCVRGYGALVVNNKMSREPDFMPLLLSGLSSIAPYGAEKFEWDPQTRQLTSAWANTTISLPNGIPSMSAATNLIYDIGQRNSSWTLEALDWNTGESIFHYELGINLIYNSAYAATEIGLNGQLYSGATLGMMRMLPH